MEDKAKNKFKPLTLVFTDFPDLMILHKLVQI